MYGYPQFSICIPIALVRSFSRQTYLNALLVVLVTVVVLK